MTHLLSSLENHGSNTIELHQLNLLRTMHDVAKNISNTALPFIEKDAPEYYERLKPLVESAVVTIKDYASVDTKLRFTETVDKQIKGIFVDV